VRTKPTNSPRACGLVQDHALRRKFLPTYPPYFVPLIEPRPIISDRVVLFRASRSMQVSADQWRMVKNMAGPVG